MSDSVSSASSSSAADASTQLQSDAALLTGASVAGALHDVLADVELAIARCEFAQQTELHLRVSRAKKKCNQPRSHTAHAGSPCTPSLHRSTDYTLSALDWPSISRPQVRLAPRLTVLCCASLPPSLQSEVARLSSAVTTLVEAESAAERCRLAQLELDSATTVDRAVSQLRRTIHHSTTQGYCVSHPSTLSAVSPSRWVCTLQLQDSQAMVDSSLNMRDHVWQCVEGDSNQRQMDIRAHQANAEQEARTFVNEPGQWPTEVLLNTTFVRALRNRLSEVVNSAAEHTTRQLARFVPPRCSL